MRRWTVLVVPFTVAFVIAACGSDDNSIFPGGDGGGGGDDGSFVPPLPDGSLADSNGGNGACTPKTCQSAGYTCGKNGDGCGGTLDCGSCTAPAYCGGGGFSKCGGSTSAADGGNGCTPQTCTTLGANCGPVGDGCGNLIATCGTCTVPDICGGGGKPSVCGDTNVADSGTACTGLCLQQVTCDAGQTTTISGTVYAPTDCTLGYCAPGQTTGDPIYGALVYVPNGTVQPFTPGVACDCGEVSGNPLINVTTGPDGKFTLKNAPVGTNIPLVIQLGRWRRQITIPAVTACADNPLVAAQTRLPRDHTEGDIPLTAVDTGSADVIHCVLPEIGIDGAFTKGEYTDPSGTGRVRFYEDASGGQVISGATPAASTLYTSATELAKYDEVIFDCVGFEDDSITSQPNVLDYGNAGGRIFLSHYSYIWAWKNSVWGTPPSDVATWVGDGADPTPDPGTGDIDQSTQIGTDFATWLNNVGALASVGPPAKITVNAPRFNASAITKPTATQFVSEDAVMSNKNAPFLFTWDPPVGPDAGAACGRVIYSDFHVIDTASNNGVSGTGTFPDSCGFPCNTSADCSNANSPGKPTCLKAGSTGNGHCIGPMTPQEKAFEFLLFDLASCISSNGTNPPVCNPATCQSLGYTCGQWGDGCGGSISCGSCPGSTFCGGGGQLGQCGTTDGSGCQPLTCQQQNIGCGPAGDGCGNLLQCGNCPAGQTCGGGGTPGQCGGGIR
jgi:hypothetical protein